MFKKLKIHIKNRRPKVKKKGKRRKENSTELPKPNIVTEVYNNNKNMLLRGNKAQKLS